MSAEQQRRKIFRKGRTVLAGVFSGALMIMSATLQAAETGPDQATQQLFDAIHANDLNGVQASVVAGARLDATDRWGLTASDLAIDKGYYKIAHFLASARNFRHEDRLSQTDDSTIGSTATPNGRNRASSKAYDGSSAAQKGGRRKGPSRDVASQANNRLTATIGAAAVPEWPSNKPNPFDPNRPAAGSTFIVLDEIGSIGSTPGSGTAVQ
ncbi:MAG: hypothetical protein H6905_10950 [Hyphomicrobiales bacterium]|nr:hypothetical protein [Hyphomicrobiales bacterium]